ncbi:hypothetical protein GCM10011331_05910 [Flavimobilis marinus]|uniref:Leader peptidase (Prepilin peptidase) / N-methyltransferase n=1 Tax=Flavimobilis marinus TaxID=285351 RepID=A0A1I2D698_9MICO|nr:hypothetical protein [Flavimobilis marinus]GHG46082.1 hypothetical protein GCM10011331_05910 [Flavimobilis marinus]SFE75490.1 hypothetical protein SAMN04488035_0405 [Flavimobilis marinus]
MTEVLVAGVIVILVSAAVTLLGVRYVASFAPGRPSGGTPSPRDLPSADAGGAAEGEQEDGGQVSVKIVEPDAAAPAARDDVLDRSLVVYAPWAVLAAVVALAVGWGVAEVPLSYQLRVALTLVLLVPVAALDVRYGVVAAPALGALLLVRAVSLAIEVTEGGPSWSSVGQEAAAAAMIGAVFGLVRLTSRAGLGGGDVLLFLLFPLLLGTRLAVTAVFVSFIVAFAYSAWALAAHRATRKDAFPLCPAVLVGTVATVLFVSLSGV